ncbi:MAG: 50S ribosomal protein L23 [Deltaproteobacteria bacterium]|nr:50S ribosomal protein L23 [Deltaproteobacteria bacterium]
MQLIDVIKRPFVTEKAVSMRTAGNRYVFEVDRRATKQDVRRAVEQLFRVVVVGVHTINGKRQAKRSLRGRQRRAGLIPWKKAIVAVKEGQKIEVVEGA